MKIIAATTNKHKIREIDAITKNYGMDLVSRSEAGVPEDFDVIEDGTTFEENSYKKAYAIMQLTGMPAVADDSGLVVDALGGAPGVFSARYAGVDGEDADAANRKKVLHELEGLEMEDRTGRFVCVITLVYPDGKVLVARGECEGHITMEEKGKNGFGYDCMFQPIGYNITFGQFDPDEKNKISHRANALKKMARLLGGNS